jgi:hypothetical protein
MTNPPILRSFDRLTAQDERFFLERTGRITPPFALSSLRSGRVEGYDARQPRIPG